MKLENYKIATYLKDFYTIYEEACKKWNVPFYDVYKNLYCLGIIKTNENDYIEMITVVGMMMSEYKLALLNDVIKPKYFIEDKIPDYLFDNIFVNEEDRYKFKKTDILVYIRNAFSHNDKSLYNFIIDEDGKVKVHINLKNTKATNGETKGTLCPFNVILDLKHLSRLVRTYNESNYFGIGGLKFKKLEDKNSLNINNDSYRKLLIDNIYYWRDLYNPLNNNQTNYINKMASDIDNFNSKQVEDKYKKTIKKNLSQIQKNTVNKYTKELSDMNMPIKLENIVFHESEKAVIFNSKLKRINVLSYIIGHYDEEKPLTIFLAEIFYKIVSNKFPEKYSVYGCYDLSNENEREIACLDFLDTKDHISLLKSLYIKYMLVSVITDDKLIIGEKTYDKDRIRNSFVHGKWYINDKDQFEIYDSDTKKEEDTYNYNYHKTVNVSDMTKCIDEYYEQLIKEKEQSNLIRTRKIR